MKNKFQDAAARDKAAAEYFSSEKFLDGARKAIKFWIMDRHTGRVAVPSDLTPQKRDRPLLEAACAVLKKDFPDLDHLGISGGSIIADTKKDTLVRKVAIRFGL